MSAGLMKRRDAPLDERLGGERGTTFLLMNFTHCHAARCLSGGDIEFTPEYRVNIGTYPCPDGPEGVCPGPGSLLEPTHNRRAEIVGIELQEDHRGFITDDVVSAVDR